MTTEMPDVRLSMIESATLGSVNHEPLTVNS